MLNLGKERDQLNVVSDQIGSPTYATDLAGVILEIIKNKEFKEISQATQIYHYSNEGEISWYDFAKEIFKIAKTNCKVIPIMTEQYPTPARRPKNSLLDNNKMMQFFNINVSFWKDSLKEMFIND